MSSPLGDLKKLDARDIWPSESQDFTPWLAKPDNMALLGDAIGLELEIESTEVAVGPYSADILAKDTGTDRYVVIENQLEKTNHDHLGKAITYASTLDAGAIVWIAAQFTEEHKRALDWLNGNMSNDIGFYAVAVELWQIDESKPAVRFNVLSRPLQYPGVAAGGGGSGELSETRMLQLQFWTAFRDELAKTGALPSLQARYWYNVPLGRSNIHLSDIANTSDGRIGVRVYIRGKVAAAAYPQLEAQKDAIEKEICQKLEWNPHPEKQDKTIGLLRDADLHDRDKWESHVRWLVETTVKFRKAFAPRVKQLDLAAVAEDEEGPT